MVPPIFLAWALKYASFTNMYAAGKAYGFHRVYRRLLEANKRLISDPKDRRIVQQNLKQAFLFPNRVFDVIEESHTIAFLNKYANELVDGISSKAPPFFVTAAKVILGKTPLGKLLDVLTDIKSSRTPKPPSP